MLLFRIVLTLLLLAGVICFAAFAITGKPVWRARGMRVVKWVILAVLAFVGVLIVQRLILLI